MDCDVQSWFRCTSLLLGDEFVDQRCTASPGSCALRRPACSSIILDLVEPVLQLRCVPVELDCDLSNGVDPSGALRFLVFVQAMALLAAEIEGHCARSSGSRSLH